MHNEGMFQLIPAAAATQTLGPETKGWGRTAWEVGENTPSSRSLPCLGTPTAHAETAQNRNRLNSRNGRIPFSLHPKSLLHSLRTGNHASGVFHHTSPRSPHLQDAPSPFRCMYPSSEPPRPARSSLWAPAPPAPSRPQLRRRLLPPLPADPWPSGLLRVYGPLPKRDPGGSLACPHTPSLPRSL